MSDLFTFDLADGMASGACPVCYAIVAHLERWLTSFWQEGRQDPEARLRFYAAGGFCRDHIWLLEDVDVRHAAGVADVYSHLATRDLAALDETLRGAHGRRRRRSLAREAGCPACEEEHDATARKVDFLLQLLTSETGRECYERSEGACLPHLIKLLDRAEPEPARFLLVDAQRRLRALRDRLEHFDRTRDHRYARERTGDDERACHDAIERYAGRRAARPHIP